MDEFSRTILKELLPKEKFPAPPQNTGSDQPDALDHLASPIVLERAAYLRKMAKLGEGWASDVLKEYPRHAIHLLVRSRDGAAEQHENFADLFFVLEGRARMATGGTIRNSKTIAPGEVRGEAVDGGHVQELRPGDIAHVPAGLPHQMLVAGDRFVTCLVVKVQQQS